jgi:hypothetical protein
MPYHLWKGPRERQCTIMWLLLHCFVMLFWGITIWSDFIATIDYTHSTLCEKILNWIHTLLISSIQQSKSYMVLGFHLVLWCFWWPWRLDLSLIQFRQIPSITALSIIGYFLNWLNEFLHYNLKEFIFVQRGLGVQLCLTSSLLYKNWEMLSTEH